MLRSGFIVLTLFIVGAFLYEDNECPWKICSCHKDKVNCSKHGRALWYIPQLPNKTKSLVFTGNFLPNVTQGTFQNISKLNLRELVLGGNHIKNISRNALELFPNLRFLDLSGNQPDIRVLKDSFYGLRNHKRLSKLYLIEMGLPSLLPDMFEDLRSVPLYGISLNFNKINKFNGSIFSVMPKLRNIGMNNNSVSSISLKGISHIKVLRMRWNKIGVVPNFCDKNGTSLVPNLKVIDLGCNTIQTIHPTNFKGKCLPKLRNLTLDETFISNVPSNAFSDLPSLVRLSLKWLRQNDIFFEKLAFNSSSLRLLYIANHMSMFPDFLNPESRSIDYKNIFRYCPGLEVLDMTKIRLTTKDGIKVRDMLRHLTNLTKLILQSTSVLNLPEHLFSVMPRLISLNLKNCLLSNWKFGVFYNVSSLKTLYLDHNEITIINSTSFPAELLRNIKELSLDKNPYSCTCDLVWYSEWLKKNTKKLIGWPINYTCKSPPKWKGKTLSSFNLSYSFCHPLSPYVIAAISVGSAIVLISVIFVILYRYRWDIKYHIYLMRAKRRGYEQLPGDEDFLYDAFVAYNSDDRVWVISEMIPSLEKKEKLKLCLHDRDFDVGKLIIDNITDKIRGSRKVVLILTNNFATSQWCNFELMMAQVRNLEEGGNMMIVVMLEEVHPKNMTNSLKLLLKTTTFVEWTRDRSGKELFWKRLVSSITTP